MSASHFEKSPNIDIKECIFRMREDLITWERIGFYLDRTAESCRKQYARYEFIRDLPPKEKTRKSVTDGSIGRQIKQCVRSNRTITLEQIKKALEVTFGDDCHIPSVSTIRNFLKNNNFHLLPALNKALIHPRNQVKRMAFATNFWNMPDYDWGRVIWSDETTVRSNPVAKEVKFWTNTASNNSELFINGQVQAGGISVMFWGCFTQSGTGPLVAIEGSMDSLKYIEVLEEHLIPAYESIRDDSESSMVFMQDNAPCHKSNIVKRFLAEKNIETLDWPPQSPDLNPIENLWAYIKWKRASLFGIPKSKNEIIEQIMSVWENLDPSFVRVYADSVSRRLSACIEANGKNTKY